MGLLTGSPDVLGKRNQRRMGSRIIKKAGNPGKDLLLHASQSKGILKEPPLSASQNKGILKEVPLHGNQNKGIFRTRMTRGSQLQNQNPHTTREILGRILSIHVIPTIPIKLFISFTSPQRSD